MTNEFVIEKPDAGGLGNYLNRITRVLHEQGHEVEIFVTRHNVNTPRIIYFNGIRVEHIPINKGKVFKLINFFDKYFFKAPYAGLAYNLGVPISLSKAFNDRHLENPFQIIQSSSVAFSGLFVKKYKDVIHMVRLSSIIENNLINDGVFNNSLGVRLLIWLGRETLKNADIIYSPSIFSSNNYKKLKNRKIYVVRPPFFIENVPVSITHYNLPQRYFIHYGSIGPLKGSDIIAEALPMIWDQMPDFQMVWVGRERQVGEMKKYRSLWGENTSKILWFEGLKKDELYSVLKNAEVSVLPSRVDNLPNTVIESLFFKVPVIGSNGASIDELVEPGKSGELIEIGNVQQLSKAIIEAWNNKELWLKEGFILPDVLNTFDPNIAANNLIKLAFSIKK